MNRVLAFLPHARLIVILLGVVGPLFLMFMRAERIDLQVAMSLAAAISVGCSLPVAPLAFRFIAIVASAGAIVLQVMGLFGPDSTWNSATAPVLWVMQAILMAALAYLLWWNQHRLMRG